MKILRKKKEKAKQRLKKVRGEKEN